MTLGQMIKKYKEMAKRSELERADIQSVLSMLEGGVSRVKIANYVRKYLLEDNDERKRS